MECSEGPEKEGVSPWHPMRCEKEGRGMSAAAGKGKPAATADRESLVEVGPPLLGGGGVPANRSLPTLFGIPRDLSGPTLVGP